MCKRLRGLLFGCLAFSCVSVSAGEPVLAWQAYNGTLFITGGVGEEEMEQINASRGEFNLQLLMAEKSGTYVTGVQVTITDSKGATSLDVDSAGPYLLVKLPAGTYQIKAVYDDRSQNKRVELREGKAQKMIFSW